MASCILSAVCMLVALSDVCDVYVCMHVCCAGGDAGVLTLHALRH